MRRSILPVFIHYGVPVASLAMAIMVKRHIDRENVQTERDNIRCSNYRLANEYVEVTPEGNLADFVADQVLAIQTAEREINENFKRSSL